MEGIDELSILKARLDEAEGRISIMQGMLRGLFLISDTETQLGLQRTTRAHMVLQLAHDIGRPEAHRLFMEMFPNWKPGRHNSEDQASD